jgi:hypothetical protein
MRQFKTNFLHGKKIQKLFGEDEAIKMVGMYSNPLFLAVLFQTKHNGTWWSIRKITKSIMIQTLKNRHKGLVRKYYNRIQRPVGPNGTKHKGHNS